MNLVVASTNAGKIAEVRRLLEARDVQVRSMAEAGLDPGVELPEEAATFAGNALSKARALAELAGPDAWCLGDDSGLQVDALDGAPGVYSARWAGVDAKGPERDRANNAKLLAALDGLPAERRGARFVCVMALVGPGERVLNTRGVCAGRILSAPRGRSGFGYDPLFLPAGFDRTMAELGMDEKNRISHRGRALRALVEVIDRAGIA